MKTLTTLTAVAALIAGISIASAQSSTAPKAGAMGSSSPLSNQQPAAGSGRFCLSGKAGPANCTFASLADCKKQVKSGQTCAANPKSATTGSK